MKWKKLPIWLKIIIIIGFIFLIGYTISQLADYFESKKQKLYKQWLDTKKEIKELLIEKRKVLLGIARARFFTKTTLNLLKFIVSVLLLSFVLTLVYEWEYDLFVAIATTGGCVFALQQYMAFSLGNRLMKLNEIEQLLCQKLNRIYISRLNVQPSRLIEIDNQVAELEMLADDLKLKIREK